MFRLFVLALLCVTGANQMHADAFWGMSYGPFRDGQSPEEGRFPSISQVSQDIEIAAELTEGLWFYSSASDTGFADYIRLAARHSSKLKIVATAFLHNPKYSWASAANAAEIGGLTDLIVDPSVPLFAVSVGSETLLRRDIQPETLISQIQRIRMANARSVPITTSEPAHIWLAHPELAEEVDLIAATIYPFWGGVSIQVAANTAIEQAKALQRRFPGKLVIISETGWPSAGKPKGDAIPSPENAARYCREVRSLAAAVDIIMFQFSFADESWKVDAEKLGVEQHFGLLTSDRKSKFSCR